MHYIFLTFFIVLSSLACAVWMTVARGEHFTLLQAIGFMCMVTLAVSAISCGGWLVSRQMSRPMTIGFTIGASCVLYLFVEFTGGFAGPIAGISIIMSLSLGMTVGTVIWDTMLKQMLTK